MEVQMDKIDFENTSSSEIISMFYKECGEDLSGLNYHTRLLEWLKSRVKTPDEPKNEADSKEIYVDYRKCDPCCRCKYAVEKPQEEIRNPWTRFYDCTCKDRLLEMVGIAELCMRGIVESHELSERVLARLDHVIRLAGEARDQLDEYLRKGRFTVECLGCGFRKESHDE